MENRDFESEIAAAYADEQAADDAAEGDYPDSQTREPEHLHFAAPPSPPLEVLVVGSLDWDEPLVVQAALLGWSQRHQDRSVVLWTTDAPEGAEETARHFAQANGWQVVVSTPEQLLEVKPTVAFGFLVPGAVGSADLVDDLAARRPVRVFTVESRRPNSRWRNY